MAKVPGVARGRETGFALLWWLAHEFCKVFFPKILAASYHHSQRPESLAAASRHSGAMARVTKARARGTHVTRVTRHAQRPARLRLTRPGPSHLQRPAVHSPPGPRLPQPETLAAARRHQPRAVTVVTRSGPPSLGAARLNRRGPVTCCGPSHSNGAAALLRSLQPVSLTQ